MKRIKKNNRVKPTINQTLMFAEISSSTMTIKIPTKAAESKYILSFFTQA